MLLCLDFSLQYYRNDIYGANYVHNTHFNYWNIVNDCHKSKFHLITTLSLNKNNRTNVINESYKPSIRINKMYINQMFFLQKIKVLY